MSLWNNASTQSLWKVTVELSIYRCLFLNCIVHWITRATKHTKRWNMSHDIVHIPTCIWWKYEVDTPPLPWAVLSVFLLFSSIQSLIVVVQWPKFGHSTTLNNKGYRAHKEMGHVSWHSSHINLYLVKIWSWHAPSPMSCAKCFSPILSHTLIVVVQWPKFGHSTTLNNKCYKAHREMGHVP